MKFQDDVIEILRNHQGLPPVLIHSFIGTMEEALEYLKLGYYLGVSGYLCKDKSNSGIRQLLESGNVPLDKILVETDAPFMYPNTRASNLPAHVKDALTKRSMTFLHRYCTFQRNEPCALPAIVEMVAAFMGKTPEEVALATAFNALKIFGLNQWWKKKQKRLRSRGHCWNVNPGKNLRFEMKSDVSRFLIVFQSEMTWMQAWNWYNNDPKTDRKQIGEKNFFCKRWTIKKKFVRDRIRTQVFQSVILLWSPIVIRFHFKTRVY